MSTIGSVLSTHRDSIGSHFQDLHGSLDRFWFATIMAIPTQLSEVELLDALRYAYTRCQESFNPNARTKAHAPTVIATKHIQDALTAAATLGGYE